MTTYIKTLKHLVLTSIALWAWTVNAQELVHLLPQDTIVMMGISNLGEHREKTADFVETFEAMHVGESLLKLMGIAEERGAEGEMWSLEPFLQEAWFAMNLESSELTPSHTMSNFMPNLMFISQLSEGVEQVEEFLGGLEPLSDTTTTFYRQEVDAEGAFATLFYALEPLEDTSKLFLVSNSETSLKEMLNRHHQPSDDVLSASKSYQDTLGRLGKGQFYSYIDYARISDLAPLAQGFGIDALVARLDKSFRTVGVMANVIRIVDDSIVTEGWQVLDSQAGDKALYKLISDAASLDPSLGHFIPQDALSYSLGSANLVGWWSYLNDISRTIEALGMSLDEMAEMFVGLKPSKELLNYLGHEMLSVVTGAGEIVAPGMPSSNLLGESAYIFKVKDSVKAQAAFEKLFAAISQSLAMFSDASGGMGDAEVSTLTLSNIAVQHYAITEGISFSYALVDEAIIIATALSSMEKVLAAYVGGENARSSLEARALEITASEVSSLTLTNMASTMLSVADQMQNQLGVMAGLTGASNLDFEAVDEASQVMSDYLKFVASRLGYSNGYAQKTPSGIYSYDKLQVTW